MKSLTNSAPRRSNLKKSYSSIGFGAVKKLKMVRKMKTINHSSSKNLSLTLQPINEDSKEEDIVYESLNSGKDQQDEVINNKSD